MARAGTAARRVRPTRSDGDRPSPPVRDLRRGARGHDVEFLARTSFDFLISLSIGAEIDRDLLPEDRAWLERTRASLDPATVADIDASFGEQASGLFHDLAALVVEDPRLGEPAALVGAVAPMSAEDIAVALLADVLPGPEGDALARRAIGGDRAAMDQVGAIAGRSSGDPMCDAIVTFLSDPAPAWDRARRALVAWLPPFTEVAARVSRLQAADLSSHASDADPLDPGALIERVTGGLRWLPDPGVRRVLLAPSYFSRPFNYIYQGTDWRLFCYPIADAILEAADRTAPPAAMVRLHRALGDPTRMRILRLLADRDWYLTELATQLELSKPTTKHHLALLRAAGLVTVTEEGNLTYYSIRRERIDTAGAELARYLS